MNKSDWMDGLKRLKDLLVTAENNTKIAKDNCEEMEFLISCHEDKIKTFK